MRNRVNNGSGSAVSLFPFLAVLLCTMGALLVLLVVLSQRAGERAVAELEQQSDAEVERELVEMPVQKQKKILNLQPEDAEEIAELNQRLEELLNQHVKLENKREQAAKHLREQQAKLAHLEEHTRRIEHELAQLHVASEQITATENKQSVDQEQAKYELNRLKQLISQKEELVEKLQKESQGKKSYAIVEYYGQEGSKVPRIYIECSADGVTIKPEGTHFDQDDFIAYSWPGNPLAQVVRATQQQMQADAERDGRPILEPLPLIIVRPDGTRKLEFVKRALKAAEIKFGFDFVGGDHPIRYPQALDPKLAKDQHHARLNARRELAAHIAAAPSRYRSQLEKYARASTRGSIVSTREAKQALFARLATAGSSESGNGLAQGEASGQVAGSEGDPKYGEYTGSDAPAGGEYGPGNSRYGQSGDRPYEDEEFAEGASATAGGPNAQGGVNANALEQLAHGASVSSTAANSSSSSVTANSSQQNGDQNQSNHNLSANFSGQSQAGAGENLSENLNQRRARNAVPIRRPIQLVVRANQFALLPSQHGSSRDAGATISMNQPARQVGAELVAGLRSHMEDWGIAGQGLYWKPVLHLKVGPDGIETAQRLAKMLERSGFDVHLPQEISLSRGGKASAAR